MESALPQYVAEKMIKPCILHERRAGRWLVHLPWGVKYIDKLLIAVHSSILKITFAGGALAG